MESDIRLITQLILKQALLSCDTVTHVTSVLENWFEYGSVQLSQDSNFLDTSTTL